MCPLLTSCCGGAPSASPDSVVVAVVVVAVSSTTPEPESTATIEGSGAAGSVVAKPFATRTRSTRNSGTGGM
eukprot:6019193-Pleurochrysis_carterae.AAC.1